MTHMRGWLRLKAYVSMIAVLFFVTPQASAQNGDPPPSEFLTRINPIFLITAKEALAWHAEKDKMGPTFSGSPSWHNFVEFVEARLHKSGAVNITRNSWEYERWHSSEWPDNLQWSLVSDGDPVTVASYAAYSGTTGPQGVTAPLLYYDPADPPKDMSGKIVVFPVTPVESLTIQSDYESATNEDTLVAPGVKIETTQTIAAHIWGQLITCAGFIRTLQGSNAAGALFVFNSSYGQMAGQYTFPVPAAYEVPALYIDRVAGWKVVEDAKNGKVATLRLEASVETSETYQLIAYLPGKNFGTAEDEMILLTTHTDGPSISQENGALGIAAIVRYFSHIIQAQRPRTLMIYLDNRHYMPGRESAFAPHDWFENHPKAWDRIVGVVGIEHLGQLEYVEQGEVFRSSGRVDPSRLYSTHNQNLIDMAIKAAKENGYQRAMITCVDRPGSHGLSQGRWYGLGAVARRRGLPGFATMGSMGAYWATTARIDHFNAVHFRAQVATMAQLTGELMAADLAQIQSEP